MHFLYFYPHQLFIQCIKDAEPSLPQLKQFHLYELLFAHQSSSTLINVVDPFIDLPQCAQNFLMFENQTQHFICLSSIEQRGRTIISLKLHSSYCTLGPPVTRRHINGLLSASPTNNNVLIPPKRCKTSSTPESSLPSPRDCPGPSGQKHSPLIYHSPTPS